MTQERKVAGCVPLRFTPDTVITEGNGAAKEGRGELEVLLVTSHSQPGTWIFPKGGVEKGESSSEAAIRETFEEAGVRGKLLGGIFPSEDESDTGNKPCVVEVWGAEQNSSNAGNYRWYLLKVDQMYEEWPEMDRQRKWVLVVEFKDNCGIVMVSKWLFRSALN